jgi:diamine N-acetyltransferase
MEVTQVTTSAKSLEELVRGLPPHTHSRAREYLEYLLEAPEHPAVDPEQKEPGPQAKVSLREVTGETVREICNLSNTLTPPRKYMVAPNAVSIAQAHFSPNAWFRAIYADDTPVGFLMLYDDPDGPEYFLWRLMIAGPHHGKGFGRRAIALLVDHVRPGLVQPYLRPAAGRGQAALRAFTASWALCAMARCWMKR